MLKMKRTAFHTDTLVPVISVSAGFLVFTLLFMLLLHRVSTKFHENPAHTHSTDRLLQETVNYDLLNLSGTDELRLSDKRVVLRDGLLLEDEARLILDNCTLHLDAHYSNLAHLDVYDNASLIIQSSTITTARKSNQRIRLHDNAVLHTENVTAHTTACTLYGNNTVEIRNSTFALSVAAKARPILSIHSSQIPCLTRALTHGSFHARPPCGRYISRYMSTLNGQTIITDSTVDSFELYLEEDTELYIYGFPRVSLSCAVSSPETHTVTDIHAHRFYTEKEIILGTHSIRMRNTYLHAFNIRTEERAHLQIRDSAVSTLESRNDSYIELENSALTDAYLHDRSALALYDSVSTASVIINEEASLFLENSSVSAYTFRNRTDSFFIYDNGKKK